MNPHWKKRRIVDPVLLKLVGSLPCVACGYDKSDAAHIRSKGSGGDDVIDNLLSLCRNCHQVQHSSTAYIAGWDRLLSMYPHLVPILRDKGWELCGKKMRRREYDPRNRSWASWRDGTHRQEG